MENPMFVGCSLYGIASDHEIHTTRYIARIVADPTADKVSFGFIYPVDAN
jgi:hypothetical protein